MNKTKLKSLIQKYQALPITQRQYAIMLPVIEVNKQLHLLFEVRSNHLRTQPGEISFPGGRIELNETKQQAALREACEELCLSPTDIEIWGELGALPPSFNRMIHLYIGGIQASIKSIHPNKAEVAEVFSVPLAYFMQTQPQEYQVQVSSQPPKDFPFHLIPNGAHYHWPHMTYPVPFYLYQERVIWGLTARAIMRLIYMLKNDSAPHKASI